MAVRAPHLTLIRTHSPAGGPSAPPSEAPLYNGCAVKNRPMRNPSFLLLLGALLVSGCAIHRTPDSVAPPVDMPVQFSQSGTASEPDRWWRSLDDPQLTTLVERALSENLTLQGAFARVEQARALATQASADLWPRVEANASAARGRDLIALGPLGEIKTTQSQYTVGLSASYEIDLWGRLRARSKAGQLSLRATREDADAAAISLAAAVGETWYALVEQRAQLELIARQVANSRSVLDLIDERFNQGQANALDVHQQRQQLASVESQLPRIQAGVEVLEHELAVLMGQPPRNAVAEVVAALPDPPELPQAGLPADLLQRRPDVRAAHLRVLASDYRMAAAIADRLPALRLTGGSEYKSYNRFADVFDNWLWNIMGGLTAPVFEGGRLKAEVERNRAVTRERMMDYGQAVLVAFREVEDALTRERQQRLYLAALERESAQATATLGQARNRYQNGLTDYISVLTAIQSVQQLDRTRLAARRELLTFRIQLYRALGGAWPRELNVAQPPPAANGRQAVAPAQHTASTDTLEVNVGREL